MKFKTAYRLETAAIVVLAIVFLPFSLPWLLLKIIVNALKWLISWRDYLALFIGHKLFVATKEYKEEVDEVKENIKEAVDNAAEEIKKEVED